MNQTRLSDIHDFFRSDRLVVTNSDMSLSFYIDDITPPLGVSRITYNKDHDYFIVRSWVFRGPKEVINVDSDHKFYETISESVVQHKLES